jgi:hypothetical protein
MWNRIEDLMDEKEARERLRQAGFAGREIYHLLQLRKAYAAQQAEREQSAMFRRLQFVRWLVRTGRLSEHVVRQQEAAQEQQGVPQPA